MPRKRRARRDDKTQSAEDVLKRVWSLSMRSDATSASEAALNACVHRKTLADKVIYGSCVAALISVALAALFFTWAH